MFYIGKDHVAVACLHSSKGKTKKNWKLTCSINCFLKMINYDVIFLHRFFQVYFPIKANVVCKIKTAHIVSGAIIALFVIFEAQWFFTIKVNGRKCAFLYSDYHGIYQQIDAVIYSYLPFILMSIFNVAIIYKMLRYNTFLIVQWWYLMVIQFRSDKTNQAERT